MLLASSPSNWLVEARRSSSKFIELAASLHCNQRPTVDSTQKMVFTPLTKPSLTENPIHD